MSYSRATHPLLHIDYFLLLGLMVLCTIGLAVLYSAADHNLLMVRNQLVRFGLGLIVLFLFAQIPPRFLCKWAPWLYILSVLILMAVLVIGVIGKGAQRWLDLGIIRFQPAEMMKLIMPITIAWFMHEENWPLSWSKILLALGLIILPTTLIILQPDLGTSLLIASSGIFVILLAGLPWRVMIALALGGGVFISVALFTPLLRYLLHNYQYKRVQVFLNPELEPLGAGYHIIQSKIAIGSGGIYGKGWTYGTQSHLEFLPERTTDFIFAVFSEELGLLGCIGLLVVYLFILTRGLVIAVQAQDTFGRLLAGSLTLTFFVYVFVNMGMVTGLLPVVGVPLPLISYGGTSMVTLLAGFGIIMAVHTHRRLLSGGPT